MSVAHLSATHLLRSALTPIEPCGSGGSRGKEMKISPWSPVLAVSTCCLCWRLLSALPLASLTWAWSRGYSAGLIFCLAGNASASFPETESPPQAKATPQVPRKMNKRIICVLSRREGRSALCWRAAEVKSSGSVLSGKIHIRHI